MSMIAVLKGAAIFLFSALIGLVFHRILKDVLQTWEIHQEVGLEWDKKTAGTVVQAYDPSDGLEVQFRLHSMFKYYESIWARLVRRQSEEGREKGTVLEKTVTFDRFSVDEFQDRSLVYEEETARRKGVLCSESAYHRCVKHVLLTEDRPPFGIGLDQLLDLSTDTFCTIKEEGPEFLFLELIVDDQTLFRSAVPLRPDPVVWSCWNWNEPGEEPTPFVFQIEDLYEAIEDDPDLKKEFLMKFL